jgi:phosphotransferase system  glucose/maltose/N-acetylglucosamine-specific IIC component
VLFCISLAVGYTGGSGAAGLVSFLGFTVFNATINSFMRKINENSWNLLF